MCYVRDGVNNLLIKLNKLFIGIFLTIVSEIILK